QGADRLLLLFLVRLLRPGVALFAAGLFVCAAWEASLRLARDQGVAELALPDWRGRVELFEVLDLVADPGRTRRAEAALAAAWQAVGDLLEPLFARLGLVGDAGDGDDHQQRDDEQRVDDLVVQSLADGVAEYGEELHRRPPFSSEGGAVTLL